MQYLNLIITFLIIYLTFGIISIFIVRLFRTNILKNKLLMFEIISKEKQQMKRYITPFIIPMALIIMITGIMMFLHYKPLGISSAHEWLGIIFVIVIVLHGYSHKKALAQYFKKKHTLLVICILFILSVMLCIFIPEDKSPFSKLFDQVQTIPLTQLQPILNVSPEKIQNEFSKLGCKTYNVNLSINSNASSCKISSKQFLIDLIEK